MNKLAEEASLFDAVEVLEEVEAQLRQWKPYADTKPTGVPWVGDVPSHWRCHRMKWTVTGCKNGIWGEEPDGENDVVCVRVADFDRVGLRVSIDEPTRRAVTAKERQGRLLKSGDLLLEKSGGGELQPVGTVMVYDYDTVAVCSNFVARMSVGDGHDTWFLAYLHHHLYAGRVNTRSIKQSIGIQNLDSRQYLDEVVGIPPLPEQRAIATFLRQEMAKIDALVEKRRRLIDLLKEKRTSLISHAVTKGLTPNVRMKSSGVGCLGDAPAHWQIKRLKYLVSGDGVGIQMGPFGQSLTDLTFTSTGFKVYGQENTINNDFQAGKRWLQPEQFAELRRYEITPGDLVVTRKGSIGQCQVVPPGIEPGIADSDTIRVRVDDRQLSHLFLVMALRESAYLQDQIQATRRGAILSGLNTQTIANLAIALPPREEQDAIMRYINASSGDIQRVESASEQAIDMLTEYRSALISAAVTGKIDVRGDQETERVKVNDGY